MSSESWRPVVEWPKYQVSDLGRVRRAAPGPRTRVGFLLKATANEHGYLMVGLTRTVVGGYERKNRLVHRLVLEAFVGPAQGRQANHRDGVKSNNCLGNLEWVTASANVTHAYEHGLAHPKVGARHGSARLCESQVLEIRATRGVVTARQWSDRLGIPLGTIKSARYGDTWKHLASPPRRSA